MKNLGKLQINAKSIMRNEELLSLRGGYGPLYECDVYRDIEYYVHEQCPGATPYEAAYAREINYSYWYPGYEWYVDCGCR